VANDLSRFLDYPLVLLINGFVGFNQTRFDLTEFLAADNLDWRQNSLQLCDDTLFLPGAFSRLGDRDRLGRMFIKAPDVEVKQLL